MHLHPLELDYPTAVGHEMEASFRQAMNSLQYEIGGFHNAANRILIILTQGISLCVALGLSFRYPGSEQWALRDLNFSFKRQQKHAIVGPNGSGKTTLILLFCRLYEPTEGRILLNGVDIRKYDYEDYLRLFSVAFQDSSLTAFPLGENVAAAVDYCADEALKVLGQLDFPSRDLNQPLGHFWNGEENFSGGERQKIAIARALYKPVFVLILDEPTAALDPRSEAAIYDSLQTVVGERTAIFISHRMSSCRFAEDILVFSEGRLVERGSHEILLAKPALYAQMWQAQAQYYQEEIKV